jgi:hypothetical protein
MNPLLSELATQLRDSGIRVLSVPEDALPKFVVLRPHSPLPVIFESPITTVHSSTLHPVPSIVKSVLDRAHVMLGAMRDFLDVEDFTVFVILNKVDTFGTGKHYIVRLAYQIAVFEKLSTVEAVIDDSYGSMQQTVDDYNSKRH